MVKMVELVVEGSRPFTNNIYFVDVPWYIPGDWARLSLSKTDIISLNCDATPVSVVHEVLNLNPYDRLCHMAFRLNR